MMYDLHSAGKMKFVKMIVEQLIKVILPYQLYRTETSGGLIT